VDYGCGVAGGAFLLSDGDRAVFYKPFGRPFDRHSGHDDRLCHLTAKLAEELAWEQSCLLYHAGSLGDRLGKYDGEIFLELNEKQPHLPAVFSCKESGFGV
jgi:hypothetical protein